MENNMKKKSWFSRNWGWVVPLGGCLTVIVLIIVFFGAVFFGVTKMIKSSVPYQYAITQASNNAEIISVLGEPIETHSMMQGEISTTNDTGKVDVKVPLKGPKGEGVLVIVGEKVNGVWVYETLYFSTETKTIDLLEDTLIDF